MPPMENRHSAHSDHVPQPEKSSDLTRVGTPDSVERTTSSPSHDMLRADDTIHQLSTEVKNHDWNKELDNRIQLFYSGDGKNADERTQPKLPEWETKRAEALFCMAREIDPKLDKPRNAQQLETMEKLCHEKAGECRRIMIDQTEIGMKIATLDLTNQQKYALFDQASASYAKAAEANYLKYNITSLAFVDKADPNRSFGQREHPWLTHVMTDERGYPNENQFEKLPDSFPQSRNDPRNRH